MALLSPSITATSALTPLMVMVSAATSAPNSGALPGACVVVA
jgi:hypothetical protein